MKQIPLLQEEIKNTEKLLNDLKNDIDNTEDVPFDFTEQIVIGYILKNKTKYKPYNDIKTLKPLLFK